MRRFLLTVRSILEAMAGFFLLLIVPFLGIDLLHGDASTITSLLGFLILCMLFLLGLLLFRDAVQIRIRLKAKSVS